MARKGTGYFDRRGQFFKTGREATVSDIAGLLGQIGDGESLAPGIAQTLLEKRAEIERLFAEHDAMMEAEESSEDTSSKVTKLPRPAS
ncbi:hypothetical protein [uncultured Erythrobacter sp.]|uniref:hypothetical protein n=1 Tax=uncultured Erythrobacter sp. TaxID=263913 RepID=UPI002620A34F|nr:hypothetical protein [uncultured Erythrobacter sp.]